MSILIIGSTGYLGKSLLETLLRNGYPNQIYLMIRSKKGKTVEERFEVMKKNVCFKNYDLSNIVLIDGDLNSTLSVPYKIDIIVNCAASISFTLPLKEAYHANTEIIHNLKEIANNIGCKKLIHISTAYVNRSVDDNQFLSQPQEELIDMRLYDIEDLCNDIENDLVNFTDIQRTTGFPNTYTFTKCLAEHILMNDLIFPKDNCYIIRPSAIMGAYEHPVPGWTESYGAGNGYFALFMSGCVTVLSAPPDTINQVNFVPVDLVSKSIYKVITTDGNKHIKHCVTKPSSSLSEEENIPFAVEYLRRINSLYYDSQYFPYSVVGDILFQFLMNLFDLSRLYVSLLFIKMMRLFSNNRSYEKKERLLSIIISSVRDLKHNYSHFIDKKYSFDVEDKEYLEGFDMCRYVPIFTEGINQHLLRRHRRMNLLERNRHIVSYMCKIMLQFHFGIFFFTSFFSLFVQFILRRCYNSVTVNFVDMPDLISNWNTQYVIVSNHRSHMDSVLIKYVLDANPGLLIKNPYILITKELLEIPVLSQLIKLTKVICVDRKNPDKIALTNDIERVLESGNSLIFYPEGTRSRTNQVLPFKKGVFSAVHKYSGTKNVKILPVSISYQMIPEYFSFKESYKSLKNGTDTVKQSFSFRATIKWILTTIFYGRNYGNVKITVGKPIDINQDFDGIINQTETQIKNNLEYQHALVTDPDEFDRELWKKID